MEQLASRILKRSSDAIMVIRLADAAIVGVNEAFLAVTGHPEHEVVGRPSHDMLVAAGPVGGAVPLGALRAIGSITEVPIGLWTHTGALRVGRMSALRVESDGQDHGVCTVRGVREPTAEERRLAAREELLRILRSDAAWPEAAASALEAFGKSLSWEFGAFWSADAESQLVRCAASWRAPASGMEELERESWRAAFAPGEGPLGRAWLSREAAWASDASTDAEFVRSRGGAGAAVRGWLGFPAWGPGGVVGVVEFASREPRPPDDQLLGMIQHFGGIFGRLPGRVGAEAAGLPAESPVRSPAAPVPPGTVSIALRELVGAVAAVTEAMERHSDSWAQEEARVALEELATGIAELNRRLEGVTAPEADDSPPQEPARPPLAGRAELPGLPTGLTLKAVSSRTGIPAATLRTWERRYGFMRPRRSPSGYRLYGEEEIARIEQVKYLLNQGVRTGPAMAAVIGAAGETMPQPDETEADADRREPRPPPGRRGGRPGRAERNPGAATLA
jgi:MerR HTH family regulatory protein/GAF domain